MSNDSRFAACLAETLKHEGGWSNHPKDNGGPTMKGVIQRVYDGWRDRQGLPRRTVRDIDEHELQAIYERDYWDVVRGDDLPAGIDLAVFDFGVNSGPARSVRYLQKVLGVAQDGHIGPATLAAVNRQNHVAGVVEKLMAERRKYLRSLDDYPTFGKGWERRCNGVEPVALAMAGDYKEATPPVVAQPLSDPDAQAATQGRAYQEERQSGGLWRRLLLLFGAGTGGTVVNQAVTAPPVTVVDSLTNLGAWQVVGQQAAAFVRFVLASPLEVGCIAAIVAAVWLAPKLLPVIWSRAT